MPELGHTPNVFCYSKSFQLCMQRLCRRRSKLNKWQKGYLQFDNVRVPEEFKVLNFSFDLPNHIQAAYFLSVEYFHCDFVPRQLVFANC